MAPDHSSRLFECGRGHTADRAPFSVAGGSRWSSSSRAPAGATRLRSCEVAGEGRDLRARTARRPPAITGCTDSHPDDSRLRCRWAQPRRIAATAACGRWKPDLGQWPSRPSRAVGAARADRCASLRPFADEWPWSLRSSGRLRGSPGRFEPVIDGRRSAPRGLASRLLEPPRAVRHGRPLGDVRAEARAPARAAPRREHHGLRRALQVSSRPPHGANESLGAAPSSPPSPVRARAPGAAPDVRTLLLFAVLVFHRVSARCGRDRRGAPRAVAASQGGYADLAPSYDGGRLAGRPDASHYRPVLGARAARVAGPPARTRRERIRDPSSLLIERGAIAVWLDPPAPARPPCCARLLASERAVWAETPLYGGVSARLGSGWPRRPPIRVVPQDAPVFADTLGRQHRARAPTERPSTKKKRRIDSL